MPIIIKIKEKIKPYYHSAVRGYKRVLSKAQVVLVRKVLKKTLVDEVSFFGGFSGKNYDDDEFLSKKIRMKAHQVDKTLLFDKILNRDALVGIIKNEVNLHCSTRLSDKATNVWAEQIIGEYSSDVRHVGESPVLPENAVSVLERLILDRRSIRSFTDQKVPFADIKKILNSGLWAPSGCNRQPVEYLIINDEKDVGYCQKLAGEGNSFPREASFNVIVMMDPRCYSLPVQRHMAYLEGGAAIQNMLLTIHAMGLGACWLFWSKISPEFNTRFDVPKWLLPVGMISVGYVKKYPLIVPSRKSVEDSSHFQKGVYER